MSKRFDGGIGLTLAMLALASSTMLAQQRENAQQRKTTMYSPALPRNGATQLVSLKGGRQYEGGGHFVMWEVLRQKGKPSPMYQVALDQVTVVLTEGAVKYTRPDGSWSIEQERFGTVRFEPAGTVVQEEGLSEVASRAVVFQIKAGVPEKLAPPRDDYPDQFPRLDATKLFETDRFIVWDQIWLPNRPVTNHLHYSQAAYVWLGGGSRLRGREQGKPPNPAGTPYMLGEIAIMRAIEIPHEEEWVEGEPRAIWVQLK